MKVTAGRQDSKGIHVDASQIPSSSLIFTHATLC